MAASSFPEVRATSLSLDGTRSAVSWPAVLGGGAAAVAVSLSLLLLGAGFGLSVVSPWGNSASATTLGVGTAIWLVVMQWLSSAFGGYLTGRLRTKWQGVHTHEVFFRDTANGFLAWALATIITASVLAGATSLIVGTGINSASTIASGPAQGTTPSNTLDPTAYFADMMFRSSRPDATAAPVPAEVKAETSRILAVSLKNCEMSAADRTYQAQLVAARTGLSQADAEKRVDDVFAQAKAAAAKVADAADQARKAAAKFSFLTFFSLLVGAFIACAAGALGGMHRDEWENRLATSIAR